MTVPPLCADSAWSSAVAEASAWIALLHGPERTAAAERGWKRWLAEDPLHAKAFELATDTWNETRARVKQGARVRVILPSSRNATRFLPGPAPRMLAVAASFVALAGLMTAAFIYLRAPGIVTTVGERRTLRLEDGTEISMNTTTRIVVDYDRNRRHVRLVSGEALFEVARHSDRPFVVSVGDRDVTALGTEFLVRRDDDEVAVTLIGGRVRIADHEPAPSPEPARELMPGERVTFMRVSRSVKVDRPQISSLTAWQVGKVDIEDLTLAEAAAEMNRYSTIQLQVRGKASSLHVSGTFRAGDSSNFANAVAGTYGLQIQRQDGRIVLYGVPHAATE